MEGFDFYPESHRAQLEDVEPGSHEVGTGGK